jgi:hypothetical protein
MYKLYKNSYGQDNISRTNEDGSVTSFGQHPDNTDYANFKTAILEDKAQLQDADGNTMTAEQAKDFVKELP